MERVAYPRKRRVGESTLARRLDQLTGLPVVHLDVVFWRPGWPEAPEEKFASRVGRLVEGQQWIIEGNFGGSLPQRVARADTVVFLDLPTSVCMWRIIDRALSPDPPGETRPGLPEGCSEGLGDTFIDWVCHSCGAALTRARAGRAALSIAPVLGHRAGDSQK